MAKMNKESQGGHLIWMTKKNKMARRSPFLLLRNLFSPIRICIRGGKMVNFLGHFFLIKTTHLALTRFMMINRLTRVICFESYSNPSILRDSNSVHFRRINKIISRSVERRIIIPGTRSNHIKVVAMEMHWMALRGDQAGPLINKLHSSVILEHHHLSPTVWNLETRDITPREIEEIGRYGWKVISVNTIDAPVVSS